MVLQQRQLTHRTLAQEAEPLFQVKLKGRQQPWIGTEAELQQYHPSWIPYAKPYVQSVASSTHHAGFHSGIHPEDMPYQSTQLAPATSDEDMWYGADFGGEPPRTPNSIAKLRAMPGKPVPAGGNLQYQFMPGTVVPPRLSKHQAPTTNAPTYTQPPVYQQQYTQDPYAHSEPAPRKRRWWSRIPAWMYFLLALALCILCWQGYQSVSQAWQLHQDDTTYGYPRTYQVDAVVGHGDSPSNPSHFIVVNLHGRVKIIELPAGSSENAKIYSGIQLYGTRPDLIPVTISFQKGVAHPYMIVQFQDEQIIYQNEQVKGVWQFVAPQNQ